MVLGRYRYPHHDIETSIWWYYMVELTFYWSLSISQWSDVKRKDFTEMFIHHITTIALLSFSWTCNLTRLVGVSNCFSNINMAIVVISDWKEKKTFCLLKSYFSPFVCGNNLNCEFYHFCLFCWMFVMKRNVTLSATTGSRVSGVALWSCWLTTVLIFSWSWPSCSTTPSSTRFVTESSESSSWSGPSRGSESSRHGYFIGKTKSAAVLMKY